MLVHELKAGVSDQHFDEVELEPVDLVYLLK